MQKQNCKHKNPQAYSIIKEDKMKWRYWCNDCDCKLTEKEFEKANKIKK